MLTFYYNPLSPNTTFVDIDLSNYPIINRWCDRLMQREPWQIAAMSVEQFELFKRRLRVLVRQRMRSMQEK